jgi:hypothetical protein
LERFTAIGCVSATRLRRFGRGGRKNRSRYQFARDTFAYACEAFSRILELSCRRADYKPLLDEYAGTSLTGDERVDDQEIVDILAEAISVRNGWKRILERCSPPTRKRNSVRLSHL